MEDIKPKTEKIISFRETRTVPNKRGRKIDIICSNMNYNLKFEWLCHSLKVLTLYQLGGNKSYQ